MAGRPRRRAMIAELTRRCIEEYDGDGERHLDYVAEWVEDGKTILELAKDMSESIPRSDELGSIEIKGAWITRHLINQHGKVAYDQRMKEARTISSYAMLDDARDIADDDTLNDRDKIARAKLRIDQRQWTAERFNKELGTKHVDVNANMNVQSMHLDALRARSIAKAEARALTSESEAAEDIAPARAFISSGAESSIYELSQDVITDVIVDDEQLTQVVE